MKKKQKISDTKKLIQKMLLVNGICFAVPLMLYLILTIHVCVGVIEKKGNFNDNALDMPVYIRDLGEDSLYTPGNLLEDFRKKYWWINEINVGDKFIIVYTSDGYLTSPGYMKILMIYKPYFLNL